MVTKNGGDATIKEKVAAWLLQQGVSTVLLMAILAYGAYASRYIVDVAVPLHLKTIIDGYDRQAAAHERVTDKMSAEWQKERELTREVLKELQKTHSANNQ